MARSRKIQQSLKYRKLYSGSLSPVRRYRSIWPCVVDPIGAPPACCPRACSFACLALNYLKRVTTQSSAHGWAPPVPFQRDISFGHESLTPCCSSHRTLARSRNSGPAVRFAPAANV